MILIYALNGINDLVPMMLDDSSNLQVVENNQIINVEDKENENVKK